MGRWSIRIGATLTVLAAMFYALALMMAARPNEGEDRLESLVPGLFFGTVSLLPGLALSRSGRRAAAQHEFDTALLGYVRSFDRFTSAELAQRTGRTELEIENRIAHLTATANLDLVFHRPDRSWIHRGRLAEDHEVVDRCQACGAKFGKQLILRGERIRCTYCDQVLTPDRPT